MKIAFLVLRRSFLKVLGSVIQSALDRGHEVLLLEDPSEIKPGERLRETDFAQWPRAVRRHYDRRDSPSPLLTKEGAGALIGPSLYRCLRDQGHDEAEFERLRSAGVRTYSLDYVYETVTDQAEAYRVIDTTFYTSFPQRRLHWDYLRERCLALGLGETDLEARSAVVGSTMTDQLAVVDPARVQKRLGLRAGQRLVVLMSLKMNVPDPWRQLVWGRQWRWIRERRARKQHREWIPEIRRGHGYRELVEGIRDFSRRHDAKLVVKSREKNADPRFIRHLADTVILDEGVFPYTSIELMALADLCVHFQSGAVLEAALAGVPSVSVKVSQAHLRDYVSYDDAYGGRPGSLQNFPGIVWPLDHAEAAARMRVATLGDFAVDPEARRRYIEKFLGFDDTKASVRVLEAIERGG